MIYGNPAIRHRELSYRGLTRISGGHPVDPKLIGLRSQGRISPHCCEVRPRLYSVTKTLCYQTNYFMHDRLSHFL